MTKIEEHSEQFTVTVQSSHSFAVSEKENSH